MAAWIFVASCEPETGEPKTERSLLRKKNSAASSGAQSSDSAILRVHWLGKTRIAADTNSARFMTLWNMPETAALEDQTLDKLAILPWKWINAEATAVDAPVVGLREIINDLVREESYFEAKGSGETNLEIVLALRLPNERRAVWMTNLAAAAEALTGLKISNNPAGDGWSLKKHDAPNFFQIGTAGEWTLIGLAQDRNELFADFQSRIKGLKSPVSFAASDAWLEINIDASNVARFFPTAVNLPLEVSRLELSVNGDAESVRTKGTIGFSKLALNKLSAWKTPTKMIHEPLVGFHAVRGLKELPGLGKLTSHLLGGLSPDQMFAWSDTGYPFYTYFAIPSVGKEEGMGFIERLSEIASNQVNPLINKQIGGTLNWDTNANAIVWTDLPFALPSVRYNTNFGMLFASLAPNPRTNRPAPIELLHQLDTNTNLICYDWEITGPRIESWIYIAQTLRLAFNKSQLAPESRGGAWLIALEPKLGNTISAFALGGTNQIKFTRKSEIGFTAIELHLLVDWLESPTFPVGLHTFVAKPEPPKKVNRHGN